MADPICHSLDARGRTLCGAPLTGIREPHAIGSCEDEDHQRCVPCTSLARLECKVEDLAEAKLLEAA